MLIAWPLIDRPSSDASSTQTAATSSGDTSRPCGVSRWRRAASAVDPVFSTMFAIVRSVIDVSTYDGHMQLNVRFFVAYSAARDRMRPRSACFAAAYALMYGAPLFAATDAMLTTVPDRCDSMIGTAARVRTNAASTFTAK